MSYIDSRWLSHSTIMRLYSEKDEILLDPVYQRMGGVWTPEKKQLLIDSILNDYDIPKIYLHAFSREQKKSDGYSYAVIDGRQRMETIWSFIEGKFALSDDFKYQHDETINLAGLGYADIAKEYPKVKIIFDSFVLPVIAIETDDLDLIEDMFCRLNEATPLNAAEKRNAIGGLMVNAIREISNHEFFTRCVAFGNRRYQHREVAARMLLVEETLKNFGKLIDTKKEYLDALARNYRTQNPEITSTLFNNVTEVLNFLANTFLDSDELLRGQGNMIVYYLVGKSAMTTGNKAAFSRRNIIDFRDRVKENRLRAEENYSDASFELLEYDRLTQQGTNDASNIKERVRVLSEQLEINAILS